MFMSCYVPAPLQVPTVTPGINPVPTNIPVKRACKRRGATITPPPSAAGHKE